nr:hypothetical protein [Micromonospora sp. DSM 115978]
MSAAPRARGVSEAPAGLHVTYGGSTYPAEEIARGAAYEIFGDRHRDGFLPDSRPGSRYPWHRYVHASEVDVAPNRSTTGADGDQPLMAPLSRTRTWADIHQLSQSPATADDPVLASVRRSATIGRGTHMVKVLSPRQFAGHLDGWLPAGFCYREYDVAHLRTPADLSVIRSDVDAGRGGPDVAFMLRWRAVDPIDYDVPAGDRYHGLMTMPPHHRVGPPVLGTGFTPSGRHLIPEFVTRDLADLPMPANAALLAYPPDGDEVLLFSYQAEQRGWLRMVGPRWRHLLDAVPGISRDQEYLPVSAGNSLTRLVGGFQDQEYEALADPPEGFRVLAMTRAARYPVETLRRRARYATWRGADCLVLREETGWLRLRLRRPDLESVTALGAQCHERGVYEVWAPGTEVTDDRWLDVPYVL